VGPTAGLQAVEYRKNSLPCRESNPRRPRRSPSLYRLNYDKINQQVYNLAVQSHILYFSYMSLKLRNVSAVTFPAVQLSYIL
jgi:hypothetical protein